MPKKVRVRLWLCACVRACACSFACVSALSHHSLDPAEEGIHEEEVGKV
jgi:hypothetical protein